MGAFIPGQTPDYYLLAGIGKNIAFFRKKAGICQLALAAEIGVGKTTIQEWERGEVLNINLPMLMSISIALRCPLSRLLGIDKLDDRVSKFTKFEVEFDRNKRRQCKGPRDKPGRPKNDEYRRDDLGGPPAPG